jgi:hypothetical protein
VEFRYLRTVIVTAVIHQCLTFELAQESLTFWHWTGITLYTSICMLAESCVCDKQSPPRHSLRPTLLQAGLISKVRPLICQVPYPLVNPIALVFSTTLQVFDLGTSYLYISLVGFLDTRTMRINHSEKIISDQTQFETYADFPTYASRFIVIIWFCRLTSLVSSHSSQFVATSLYK